MKHLFMKDLLNSSLTEMPVRDTTQEKQNDWEKNYQKEVIFIQEFWKISRYIQTANCCVYPLT